MSKFVAVEMGTDAAGQWDNRPLGRCGRFLEAQAIREADVAQFASKEAAYAAAENAPRRLNTTVEVVGRVGA